MDIKKHNTATLVDDPHSDNYLIEQSISSVLRDDIRYFNSTRSNPVGKRDVSRYYYNRKEVDLVLSKLKDRDSFMVSEHWENDEIFCWEIKRVRALKIA